MIAHETSEFAARDDSFVEIRIYEDGWLKWLIGESPLAHWPGYDVKAVQGKIDPRLSLVGKTWYWNGVPVTPPVPENSDVSFAIARAIRHKISKD